MDYNRFKEEVLRELKEKHGDVMEKIRVTLVKKTNGVEYEGVVFRPKGAGGIVVDSMRGWRRKRILCLRLPSYVGLRPGIPMGGH